MFKWFKTFLTVSSNVSELEKKICYKFDDKSLLKLCLTHKSINANPKNNFERLEFLGDAVLDHVVSEWLYNRYPNVDEGKLTEKRAALVKKQFLSKMASKLNLHKFAITNTNLDIFNKKVIYNLNGNIFESLIGAIFLDGGIKPTEKFIGKFLLYHENEAETDDNYKGQLYEVLQEKGYEPPKFCIKSVDGPDHDKIFIIEAVISEKEVYLGEGKNKKEAEQIAAKNALKNLSF